MLLLGQIIRFVLLFLRFLSFISRWNALQLELLERPRDLHENVYQVKFPISRLRSQFVGFIPQCQEKLSNLYIISHSGL